MPLAILLQLAEEVFPNHALLARDALKHLLDSCNATAIQTVHHRMTITESLSRQGTLSMVTYVKLQLVIVQLMLGTFSRAKNSKLSLRKLCLASVLVLK